MSSHPYVYMGPIIVLGNSSAIAIKTRKLCKRVGCTLYGKKNSDPFCSMCGSRVSTESYTVEVDLTIEDFLAAHPQYDEDELQQLEYFGKYNGHECAVPNDSMYYYDPDDMEIMRLDGPTSREDILEIWNDENNQILKDLNEYFNNVYVIYGMTTYYA